MSLIFNIPANYIAAIRLFAGKNDNRFGLNGVALERRNGKLYLIASNAKILGCIQVIESGEAEPLAPVKDIIIPVDLLKHIKGEGNVLITVGEIVGRFARPILIGSPGVPTVSGTTLDCAFVDWRKVIPKTISGEVGQFDPSWLSVFQKAAHLLVGKKNPFPVNLGHNGRGAATWVNVDGFPQFFGAIMSLGDRVTPSYPNWISDETT